MRHFLQSRTAHTHTHFRPTGTLHTRHFRRRGSSASLGTQPLSKAAPRLGGPLLGPSLC